MQDSKKKTIGIILAALAFVAVVGATYAFVTKTLTGNKKVVVNAGTLNLILNEGNEITISDALPMYDEVGMIQDEVFTFSLINQTSNPTDYILKLEKIETDFEFDTADVKYYLTKDGVGQPALLSTIRNEIIDKGTIEGNNTINYTLRLWIKDEVEDLYRITGRSLSYKLKLEAKQQGIEQTIPSTVTFGGVTKNVKVASETMFNYTSEGCTVDFDTWEETCTVEPTNGIYAMEDDDDISYFFRGDVDNYVKFGNYRTKKYYVYRGYTNTGEYEDYFDLEACKEDYDECSGIRQPGYDYEDMYWRIVRINGDGTIRMIYAGTSVDAEGQDLGIGLASYNTQENGPKYTGYTYDKLTNETDSNAKSIIDDWYENFFEGKPEDIYVATGKFCSDSSGYHNEEYGSFAPEQRVFANLHETGNSAPSFKCPTTTDPNYGGSYNLKAGMITYDEAAAVGLSIANSLNNFLSNSRGLWTMSPNGSYSNQSHVGVAYENLDSSRVGATNLLRPVINLNADVIFVEGTDGSKTRPYEIKPYPGIEK